MIPSSETRARPRVWAFSTGQGVAPTALRRQEADHVDIRCALQQTRGSPGDHRANRQIAECGRPGRPAVPAGTTALVLRLAKENPAWGYQSIRDDLATMGIAIAPSSVWPVLRASRHRTLARDCLGRSWAELLAAQAKGLTRSAPLVGRLESNTDRSTARVAA